MSDPCNLAKNLSKSFAELYCKVTTLEVLARELEMRILQGIKIEEELKKRVENLERDGFQRELALDHRNSEGLGEI